MAQSTQTAENDTTFCALGKLRIEDKERVSVGVLIDNTQMAIRLDKPAKLGNALTIGAWLHNSWHTTVDELIVKSLDGKNKVPSQSTVTKAEVKNHLDGLERYPREVTDLLASLFVAKIWISDLDIRRWQKDGGPTRNAYKFGIVIDFKDPGNPQDLKDSVKEDGLPLFGDIVLEEICLGIISTPKGEGFDFAKAPQPALPNFTILPAAQLEKAAADIESKDAATDPPKDAATDPPKDAATDPPKSSPPARRK